MEKKSTVISKVEITKVIDLGVKRMNAQMLEIIRIARADKNKGVIKKGRIFTERLNSEMDRLENMLNGASTAQMIRSAPALAKLKNECETMVRELTRLVSIHTENEDEKTAIRDEAFALIENMKKCNGKIRQLQRRMPKRSTGGPKIGPTSPRHS
jgi:hypothetical protein